MSKHTARYLALAAISSDHELRRLLERLPRQAIAQRAAVRLELERRELRERCRTRT